RDRIFGALSRSRIELAEDLLAEARVPRHPDRIDDDVVRLPGALRQVVLGVDNLSRSARRPRRGFERILPLRTRAQIDRREVLGLTPPRGRALLGRVGPAADPRRRQFLD